MVKVSSNQCKQAAVPCEKYRLFVVVGKSACFRHRPTCLAAITVTRPWLKDKGMSSAMTATRPQAWDAGASQQTRRDRLR